MNVVRGLLFATFVHFTLFWMYIIVSILSGRAQPSHYFIDNLPALLGIEMTFLNLGIITWAISFVALWGYLSLESADIEVDIISVGDVASSVSSQLREWQWNACECDCHLETGTLDCPSCVSIHFPEDN